MKSNRKISTPITSLTNLKEIQHKNVHKYPMVGKICNTNRKWAY